MNGLDYLERLGFVHHDVKLANILVDVAPREGALTGGEVFGEVVRRSYRGVVIDFGATHNLMFEADRAGRPMVLVRLGSRIPDPRGDNTAFFLTGGPLAITQ